MYYDIIDGLVLKHIDNAADFYNLVDVVKGVHPIEIRDSVNRLLRGSHISTQIYEKIIAHINCEPQVINNDDINELPVPHQVDFDWRFSKLGIKSIVHRIEEIIKSSEINGIAFIGSPSLFKYFSENTDFHINFFLIDFNAFKHINKDSLKPNFRIVNCNVNYEMPDNYYRNIDVDLVVMDPPWYLEYYMRFFDICSDICNKNAFVLGAFPPQLTRNTVAEEINQLSQYISVLGFGNLLFKEHLIVYSTPPFERNVLKANGITNYPPNWRVGDLFEVRRIGNADVKHSYDDLTTEASKWQETSIGMIRIKCRQKPIENDKLFSITVNSIYSEDIYPSVSRRFKGHENINVWTSGNRVFHCNNIPLFKLIVSDYKNPNLIQALASDYGVVISEDHKSEIITVQKLIQNLVDIEEKEYGNWVSCITI